ncbi:cellulose synthase/poly-beta-1,6-N-acetylglucosamine synthase-like glycosyltransferase [Halohasta litchfieldiae]|jgi:cellulose synthase/poly-beta-1,6-N-acetylglucosamine synthase-like glycosyltransferase|uniref:Glycosyltransferase, catalytic subunit of cellulose synthase and poly-beta-1,6-N-acetylglucosamine synthase n=1 Tax=Halohasta litchfieldiae TaxID=1073996 RepID=A0A1H6X719_9EURY|nr:glycosyltransferase family 2 protein [Halohasta litchfieldiae]ATW87298.1 cellulose synthase/poly-beta-1,6-N-acetylglucosamine synthase-like glycosyltransferase [Halohasta litchfieldiae]SEJ23846.1 Glycosyltransferase, catalytic subunit of cellulose synthase and poly-beta-1,6-N-acetylglucosamine synthase [Halohasta litchfieldiae]
MKRLLTKGFETAGSAGVFLTLLLLGLYQGLQQTVLSLNLVWLSFEIVWMDAVATSIVFIGFVALSGGLLLREVWTPATNVSSRDDGPQLTAIIPVYRDGAVLHRSVESLKRANYENLEIVIACEPDDKETLAVAHELAGGAVSVIESRYPGSKSGAIQTAVEASIADSFAVFDADEIVDEDFLSAGMGALVDGGYDVFQGRRIPEPTGFVEALAYCERVMFHASYKIVEPSGFYNCRSSSTLFSREAFETVGGFDDLLTEDLAFAHKCFRHGLDVRQARNYTNVMEAPHTLADFWGQRKRWRIGQVEVLDATLRGRLTDGPLHRRVLSLGRMVTSLGGSIFTVVILSKWSLLVLTDAELFYLLPIVAVAVLAMGVGLADSRSGSIDSVVPITLCAPLVYPVFGLLSIKSILEYTVSWDGTWYHVEKTGS